MVYFLNNNKNYSFGYRCGCADNKGYSLQKQTKDKIQKLGLSIFITILLTSLILYLLLPYIIKKYNMKIKLFYLDYDSKDDKNYKNYKCNWKIIFPILIMVGIVCYFVLM